MFFRIVDTACGEFIEYEHGEGNGIEEFQAFKTGIVKNSSDRVVDKETVTELKPVYIVYKGGFEWKVAGSLRKVVETYHKSKNAMKVKNDC